MKVRDLELEPVAATSAEESIADAADRMRFFDIGSLAVMDGDALVGILTERDLARAVADRSDSELPVRAYMTSDPTTIGADADVVEAGALMLALGTRHLPVKESTRVIGMVSVRDLLLVEIRRETAARAVVATARLGSQ